MIYVAKKNTYKPLYILLSRFYFGKIFFSLPIHSIRYARVPLTINIERTNVLKLDGSYYDLFTIINISRFSNWNYCYSHLELVNRIPFTAPNVDKATNTGIVHAIGPYNLSAKVYKKKKKNMCVNSSVAFMYKYIYTFVWYQKKKKRKKNRSFYFYKIYYQLN